MLRRCESRIKGGSTDCVLRNLLTKNGFQTASALQEQSGPAEVRERHLQRKFPRTGVTSHVGFEPLLRRPCIGGLTRSGPVKRLHSPHSLQRAGDSTLLAFGNRSFPKVQEGLFVMIICAKLWQCLHRVSSDLFRRILEQRANPASGHVFLFRRPRLSEHDRYRSDDRDGLHALCGCRLIEGGCVIPERVAVELAQSDVMRANALI